MCLLIESNLSFDILYLILSIETLRKTFRIFLKISFKIKINEFIVIKTHVRLLLSIYRIIFNRLEFMSLCTRI